MSDNPCGRGVTGSTPAIQAGGPGSSPGDRSFAAQDQGEYAEREIRRQVGQRLTEQQRSWLLKMPSWTTVRGEDILRHLDALVTDNALLRDENARLRREIATREPNQYVMNRRAER